MATELKFSKASMSEFKARLAAIGDAPPGMLHQWQSDTTSGGRAHAPARTGRGRASIRAGWIDDTKAKVIGAYWLIFIDRGTKAHTIALKKISGSKRGGYGTANVLTSGYTKPRSPGQFGKGGTVFGRKVRKRRQAPRPFLTEAGRRALTSGNWDQLVIQLWNQKRRGRWTKVKSA